MASATDLISVSEDSLVKGSNWGFYHCKNHRSTGLFHLRYLRKFFVTLLREVAKETYTM